MEQGRLQLFTCMRGYSRKQFGKDLAAGLLVAVIAFPLSVALAIASGLSPEKGLYTAIIGGFFVSAFGGSKVNIGGATAATVMTVFTIVEKFGLAGLAAATVMAGIFLIIMGLLRLGALLKYIPRTMTSGFTAAIAVGIFSGQLKGFLGLEMGTVPVKVLEKFEACAKVLDTIHIPTLSIGLLAMVILILLPRVTTRIPNSLAAILITTPVVFFGDLDVATIHSVYGELPSHVPQFQIYRVSVNTLMDLLPSALTLAILIAIVSLLACVVTDGMTGEHHVSNQELIAEGIANIFCGFFGAVPAAGAVARASTSVKNGGRTPVAGLVHSMAVLFILLFLMPLAGFIPMPTLSAILIMVAYNMSNWREFVFMAKHAPKSDFIVLMGTFLFGILVDLLFAVEVGILLSAILFMRRMSEVSCIRSWTYPTQEELIAGPEGVGLRIVPKYTLVYELEGPVFFATADAFESIPVREDTRVVIFRMKNAVSMDITALNGMEQFLEFCQSHKVTLILSHVMAQPYSVMKKAGFIEKVGKENYCTNIDEALKRAKELTRQ